MSRSFNRVFPDTKSHERLVMIKDINDHNFDRSADLEISSLPALALYINGHFERFIGGLGKKEEVLKQLPPL